MKSIIQIIKLLTIDSTFSNSIKIGPFRTIYESEKFLCIHRYSKLLERENLCAAIINAVTYRDSKIITQESVVEYLDYDPAENQDWNWEDYEWLDWDCRTLFILLMGLLWRWCRGEEDEAKGYLTQYGYNNLDRDGDEVPCEALYEWLF